MREVHSQVYHIYGRKTYPQPLTFVDRLQIEETSTLLDEALKRVGEDGWIELVAFPASSIVQVIPRGDRS